jgi:Protein of unknown function (DUF2855)
MPTDFQVNRSNLREHRLVDCPSEQTIHLEPNQALLEIEHFALTSNNITYASFGSAMRYWDFFPTGEPTPEWGRIPVWGFATITRLGSELITGSDLRLGERVYGYFPMSTYLIVQPAKVSPATFYDSVAHRSELHPVYNQYRRCEHDPSYLAQREAQQMLVQPLFLTSFLIDDFLHDQNYFGAEQVVITSASSKTAYCLAHCLNTRNKALRSSGLGQETKKIIGLTSPSNAVFVNGMATYDQVSLYDSIEQLDPLKRTVLVDMAGNADIRQRIHKHFNEQLTYSCSVGGTHWDALSAPGQGSKIPGPKPTLFFAPAQAKKRAEQWGSAQLAQKIAAAWTAFQPNLDDWMHVLHMEGPVAVAQVYEALLNGKALADQGYSLSLK